MIKTLAFKNMSIIFLSGAKTYEQVYDYDIVVIGGGPGGLAASKEAAR
jgi:ribulose 1,5-bisphosphate synthetase/thiazole synthase